MPFLRSRSGHGPRPARRRGPGLVGALALVLALASCKCEPSYLSNRWSDLTEVLDADVGLGAGLHGSTGFSHVFELGLGSYQAWRAGLRHGDVGGFDERRDEVSLGPFQLHEVEVWPFDRYGVLEHRAVEFAEPGFRDGSWLPWEALRTDRSPMDLSIEAHVLVGVRLRLRTGELLDGLLVLFTLDPAGDDLHPLDDAERAELQRQLRSPDAGDRERAVRKLRRFGLRPPPEDPDYFTYADPEVRPVEQERAADAYARALAEFHPE